MDDAPLVIALGPGYEAGKDVHAVIETNRGHNLGRVYLQGCAEPNTGVPGTIGGYGIERILRAPCAATLYGIRQIRDQAQEGDAVIQNTRAYNRRVNTTTTYGIMSVLDI